MDRVSREVVVRRWLASGREHPEDADRPSLTKEEAYEELTRIAPAETAILWQDRPVEWYRTVLSLRAVKDLRLSRSPRLAPLRDLAADGTIWDLANAIYDGRHGSTDGPAEGPGDPSLDRVLELATEYPFEGSVTLVVTTRQGCSDRRIQMGGERAVAMALAVRYGKSFDPPIAYVGVERTPVLEPLRERLCGALCALSGRLSLGRRTAALGERLAPGRDRRDR